MIFIQNIRNARCRQTATRPAVADSVICGPVVGAGEAAVWGEVPSVVAAGPALVVFWAAPFPAVLLVAAADPFSAAFWADPADSCQACGVAAAS